MAVTPRPMHLRPIDGGHLFPFERPLEAAAAIREMVGALLDQTRRHAERRQDRPPA